jgi:hypothetical protein
MPGRVPTTYLIAAGRIPAYFSAIQQGTAPTRFTLEYLEALGFKVRNDRALIPLLKELRFLDDQNRPTASYREFLDQTVGKTILGRQVLASYEGLFELVKDAHKKTPAELEGKFKTLKNVSENVAGLMAQTFANLCKIADIDSARSAPSKGELESPKPIVAAPSERQEVGSDQGTSFHYHIEIHLPNTTDTEVFRAIFKALREHIDIGQ